jgi:signal transduction histidine kinase
MLDKDREFSLRVRLTTIVLLLFIGSWVVAALVTTQSARTAFLQETDRALYSIVVLADTVGSSVAVQLQSAAAQGFYTGEEIGRDPRPPDAGQDTRRLIQLRDVPGFQAEYAPRVNVWTEDDHYLVGSGTPAFASPAPPTRTGVAADQQLGQEQWRVVYRHNTSANIWYAAGVDARQIRFGGTELLLRLLAPLVLVVPLTVMALYLGIAQGLHPLGRIVEAIEARRRSPSLEPLPVRHTPREMRPVVASLNQLLERLAASLEDEKSFTANAAHELKTPLAAISAEVHLCQRLTHEVETRDRMERVLQRVERASHSVNQLLILARLDPQYALPRDTVDLYALLQDVIADSGSLASERQLHVQVDVRPCEVVPGDWETLAILLRNLVVNAFRYTPQGGAVSIAMVDGILTFSNDSRPILNPGRLTDRFFRSEDTGLTEAVPGSGLGLAIVLRICELHGFGFSVDYREGERRFHAVVDFRRRTGEPCAHSAKNRDDAHTAG